MLVLSIQVASDTRRFKSLAILLNVPYRFNKIVKEQNAFPSDLLGFLATTLALSSTFNCL